MSHAVEIRTPAPLRPVDYTGQQLSLIRRTVASDCNVDEFDLFIEVAKRVGLDPFRRQIYAVVYNRDRPDKRKMSIITGIDGFRAVAARNRDYRPDDAEPQFEFDDALKCSENPTGMRKCVVKAYKLAPDNQWHPVVGVAFWAEYAPTTEDAEGGYDWVDTGETWPDTGKPKRKKVPRGETVRVPSGKWATMPHVMISKCAEAQALRKGWPEDLSGIYAPEEMEGPMLDVTASAAVAAHEQEERLRLVNAHRGIAILWRAGEPIDSVPVGQMADRAAEFIRQSDSVAQLEWWRGTNTMGLREFWALAKTDALEVKRALEARIAKLSEVPALTP